MVSAEDCDAVIAEARAALGRGVTGGACQGWRFPMTSTAAAVLAGVGFTFSEGQVVRYGPGEGYGWHRDGPGRDVAVTVQLSDPATYAGGVAELEGGEAFPAERGAVATFDAQRRHRVLPVTRGERWVLVGWMKATLGVSEPVAEAPPM
jgi:predicted 2-oxoglutarate/Fe(II)-dependent dioxygenase YbiX